MTEMILLKQGEMVLKGTNRHTFEDKLRANIARRLRPLGKFKVYTRQSTTYVEPMDEGCDMDAAYEAMKHVFGVVGLSRARACEKDADAMLATAKTYLHDDLMAARTFKVESKRSDKTFPMKSPELCRELGARAHGTFSLNIANTPKRAYILADHTPLQVVTRTTCEGDSSWRIAWPEKRMKQIDTVICVEMEEDEPIFEPIR